MKRIVAETPKPEGIISLKDAIADYNLIIGLQGLA
jgi:hypothetical protein